MVYDAIIIGGGFFGTKLALFLASKKQKILVLEKEKQICSRASANNQARIHNGYHYLRSYKTAASSHKNYSKFINEYHDCSYSAFANIYGIAQNSFTSPLQFEDFCQRLKLPYKKLSPNSIQAPIFNPRLFEQAYLTEEITFDINKLRSKLIAQAKELEDNLDFQFETEIIKLEQNSNGQVDAVSTKQEKFSAKRIFNISYAGINQILRASNLETIPLKYELAEIALVQVPQALEKLGVTIMDGPFFSCIPFPSHGLYSLSHVRYTPHCFWNEQDFSYKPYELLKKEKPKSNFEFMKKDALRYIPSLAQLKYKSSIFEIKTVVSRNETDDGRPIVLKKHSDNIYSVLGTKLDNIYDLEQRIEEII